MKVFLDSDVFQMWGRILRIDILNSCSTVAFSLAESVQLKSLGAVHFDPVPMLQFDRGISLELLALRSTMIKHSFP